MGKKRTYTTKNFKNWSQFLHLINNLTDNWVFRGQSNSEWDLKSLLERTDFFRLSENIERSFLIDFQRGAKNFLMEKELPENLIEWLALMQHHGAPTRLLDFTKSPYIASYFAFENADVKDKSIAVWAINTNILKGRVIEHINLSHSEEYEKARSRYSDEDFEKTRRQFTDKDFEYLFYRNDNSCILPVEPFKMNKRYALQQSIFISPGNSYETFMEQLEFLEDDIEKIIVKICLPTSLKKEVLRDLQKMNINRASIFPDLDGYSIGLKMKYNLLHSMDEHKEKLSKLLKDKKYNLYL